MFWSVKTIATLVNYPFKSFAKLTPGCNSFSDIIIVFSFQFSTIYLHPLLPIFCFLLSYLATINVHQLSCVSSITSKCKHSYRFVHIYILERSEGAHIGQGSGLIKTGKNELMIQ